MADALSISIWSSFVCYDLLSVDRIGKMRLDDSMTISVVNPMVFGNVIGGGVMFAKCWSEYVCCGDCSD